MQNKVQLITYANRFGGNGLADLLALIQGPLHGLFGGVHILPFYLPIDGADAGFDPIDHSEVDPQIGAWRDIAAIAGKADVMADVIVNHMSANSPQFRDYIRHGADSAYRGLFLTRDDVFPGGASDEDLRQIYRPRPGVPFTEITLDDGSVRAFWTTFTSQQIDINVSDPQGQQYIDDILYKLNKAGVRMVRLDAVGYAVKKAGTSCFMLPETFGFIDQISARARELQIEVLVEVHSYYKSQIDISRRVDWVYDFALPPLVLHAFFFKTATSLKEWVRIRPTNAVTVLDTHDGIGIIDIGAKGKDGANPGLVPPDELNALVELIHQNTRGQSRLATGQAASNLDLYQVNATYYDALGRSDPAYLLARAIQFFLPGVPQVYYVGLLAGENDMALLARTGVGRDINRHYYGKQEVLDNLARPVVRNLMDLIRLRNIHPAFGGEFALGPSDDTQLCLRWTRGDQFAELTVDFACAQGLLRYTDGRGVQTWTIDQGTATRPSMPFGQPVPVPNGGRISA